MFFSSKPKEAKLNYIVHFTKMIKYQEMIHYLGDQKEEHLLLYFFDHTRDELNALLDAAHLTHCKVESAHDFSRPAKSAIILAEIHPLESVMKRTLAKFSVEETIRAYIGMDEVMLKVFGSDKIVQIMEKLGMQPNEAISHRMIDQSIDSAMKKLEEKIKQPIDIRTSPEDWAKANGVN